MYGRERCHRGERQRGRQRGRRCGRRRGTSGRAGRKEENGAKGASDSGGGGNDKSDSGGSGGGGGIRGGDRGGNHGIDRGGGNSGLLDICKSKEAPNMEKELPAEHGKEAPPAEVAMEFIDEVLDDASECDNR